MYICGIDVGKRQHTAIILDEQGQIVEKAFTITNDRRGFDQLHQVLSRYAESIQIALEATGHYWLALYDQLSQRGHRITVLNALQVRAYRKIGMRKRKTDRIDAHWIAEFVRFANPAPSTLQIAPLLQLRE